MKKTILCLVNNAAYSRIYFEGLQPYLERLGYNVVYALDSHLSDFLYYDRPTVMHGQRYFTDFLRSWSPKKNIEFSPKWNILFSDFDRFIWFDLGYPLKNNSNVKYKDIPDALYDYFVNIFEKENPVAVLYEPVSNSFAMVAKIVADKFGVPFCSLSPSRVPGRIELSMRGALNDYIDIGKIYKNKNASMESLSYAKNYVDSIDTKIPDYMKTNNLDRVSLVEKYGSIEKLKTVLRLFSYRYLSDDDYKYAYQHGDPLKLSFSYFRRAVRRKFMLPRVSDFYIKKPNLGEKYIVYPLHFHPEASTSILAGDFVDEMSLIKAIAFRLPTDVVLYVKEHPSAVGLQDYKFYKTLRDLPNIRLISSQVNSKELVRGSLGLMTLTSTMGFEAAALNKPVVAFGDVMYGYFPNVRMISNYSDVSSAIDWIIDYKKIPSDDIILAVGSYVEFTRPGSFDFRLSIGNDESMKGVANLIDSKLRS